MKVIGVDTSIGGVKLLSILALAGVKPKAFAGAT